MSRFCTYMYDVFSSDTYMYMYMYGWLEVKYDHCSNSITPHKGFNGVYRTMHTSARVCQQATNIPTTWFACVNSQATCITACITCIPKGCKARPVNVNGVQLRMYDCTMLCI